MFFTSELNRFTRLVKSLMFNEVIIDASLKRALITRSSCERVQIWSGRGEQNVLNTTSLSSIRVMRRGVVVLISCNVWWHHKRYLRSRGKTLLVRVIAFSIIVRYFLIVAKSVGCGLWEAPLLRLKCSWVRRVLELTSHEEVVAVILIAWNEKRVLERALGVFTESFRERIVVNFELSDLLSDNNCLKPV
jgi:hypothetical protein